MLSMPPFVSWYFKAHEQLRVFIPEKKWFVISRKTKLKKIFINNDSALSTGYAMKVIQRVYCNDLLLFKPVHPDGRQPAKLPVTPVLFSVCVYDISKNTS